MVADPDKSNGRCLLNVRFQQPFSSCFISGRHHLLTGLVTVEGKDGSCL